MSSEKDAFRAHTIKVDDTFRKGITAEEVLASYDEWSEYYEKIINKGYYKAPVIALEEVLRRIPPDCRAATRVLDVPAGTGWLGPKLYKEGFRHIDALEPSNGMLKKLREKGVYTNEFQELIGTGECSIPADTYDLLISAGGWGEGHIPISGLNEFVRISKKGGLVIIVMQINLRLMTEDYKDKLEPYMEELERKGAWTKVERRVVPHFCLSNEGEQEGDMFVFRVA